MRIPENREMVFVLYSYRKLLINLKVKSFHFVFEEPSMVSAKKLLLISCARALAVSRQSNIK